MSLHGAPIHQKRKMIPFEEALAAVLTEVPTLPGETVQLNDALHRVLACHIKARENQPATPLSSRDGYAFKGNERELLRLTIVGETRAGGTPIPELSEGQGARIFTGAPLPQGADTVLMQEDASFEGEKLIIAEGYPKGKYVRQVGSDCEVGELMLKEGTRLNPAHLALLASLGIVSVPVYTKPTVGFLVNGDEIIAPGTYPCPPGAIRNSNRPAVENLIREAGGRAIYLGTIGDCPKALEKAFKELPPLDLLITIGGASVGDYDHVLQTAINQGYDVAFSRIALKPGKPTIFGKKENTRLIGLPGNPVSCIVVFQLLVRPFLLSLSGASEITMASSSAFLASDEKKEKSRRYFLPGTLRSRDDGTMEAIPSRHRESSALASLAEANVLIVLPEGLDFVARGSEVSILHFDRKEVAR